MIIQDWRGGTLSLTKQWLTELTGGVNPAERWRLKIRKLARASDEDMLYIHLVESSSRPEDVGKAIGATMYYPNEYRIGCRTFSPETFARILKAARAANKPVRKTNKPAKKKSKKVAR